MNHNFDLSNLEVSELIIAREEWILDKRTRYHVMSGQDQFSELSRKAILHKKTDPILDFLDMFYGHIVDPTDEDLSDLFEVICEDEDFNDFRNSVFFLKNIVDVEFTENSILPQRFRNYLNLLSSYGKPDLYPVVYHGTKESVLADFKLILPDYIEFWKMILFPKDEVPAEPLPAYILEMIQAGLLYPDGKRTMKNIQDIADFLVRKNIKISGQFLSEMFIKVSGKPYSLASCNDAVTLAMTSTKEYIPVKNKEISSKT